MFIVKYDDSHKSLTVERIQAEYKIYVFLHEVV